MRTGAAVLVMVLGMASVAYAALGSPEIDAGSGGAAIALLAGGALILSARRKKKSQSD